MRCQFQMPTPDARAAHPAGRRCLRADPRGRGFTLIELLIAIVVVGLLAAVALPSFMDSMRKSRRTEAFAALSQVQLAQERWRANNAQYTTTLSSLQPPIPSPTTSGYYTLLVSPPATPFDLGSSYTVTATASGSQAADAPCAKLAVKVERGNVQYGSGNGSIDYADPNRCWAR